MKLVLGVTKPNSVPFHIPKKLSERIELAVAELGVSYTTFVETAIDAALKRHESKHHRHKNPVGRPRISAEEKEFRDAVREIDEMYLSIQRDFQDKPGVFDDLFGHQVHVFQTAVAASDYDMIRWWQNNAPWQKKNPQAFLRLLESYHGTVASNSSEGAHEDNG